MFGLKKEHIDAIRRCFSHHEAIDKVILYGSRAKGNHKSGSDIDLAILDNNKLGFKELVKLENEIDDLLLPYKVDLSVKGQITDLDLIDHIDRLGMLFYEKGMMAKEERQEK